MVSHGLVGDQHLAIVFDDGEIATIGAVQIVGREYLFGRPLRDQLLVKTNDLWQVIGHGIQVVTGDQNGNAVMVQVCQQKQYLSPPPGNHLQQPLDHHRQPRRQRPRRCRR